MGEINEKIKRKIKFISSKINFIIHKKNVYMFLCMFDCFSVAI